MSKETEAGCGAVADQVQRPVGRLEPERAKFTRADLVYAYECAATFLEAEEWPEDDGGAQVAAYREAAKRIRRRADVLASSMTPNVSQPFCKV